jgi:hypothetical protein
MQPISSADWANAHPLTFRARQRNGLCQAAFRTPTLDDIEGGFFMRSVILALLGVPIPVILLLAFCTHHL